ncbi:hypothetical protein LX15_000822 [Streptoalloteichus tenebrarius]|uniref:Uncharacterized protein n=1 Tax=Streptoalloteichus tenebrarius (strain ATCC 17920 / DSM 40477 / JCM 4838 / CBS 697.72 / NBRC 16177 / NCIMB 11028 / NRRL B-12390 / A12253. 1 / ISP 5477) TaxID=1933 RepID=A0ABT1HNQ2_STRSD|nr:hypothetical protein [Streptoalloteichus tenebrarius]
MAAAHSTEAIGYARSNFRGPGHQDPGAITVETTGVPVYALDPAFVRGETVGSVATLAYVAVVAHAQNGGTATIQVTPASPGHLGTEWRVDTVLSGDDERQLAGQLPSDTVLLSEPQINGWYALSDDGVRLLRASLPQSAVGVFVPLGEYQRQVRDRYADKQPGSAHHRDSRPAGEQQAQPSGAPRGARSSESSSSVPWLAAAVALLLGVAYLARRRCRTKHIPQ